MDALMEWIKDVGNLVLFLGIVKIGYGWLYRAFNGRGKFM